jgi:hypothetical protein
MLRKLTVAAAAAIAASVAFAVDSHSAPLIWLPPGGGGGGGAHFAPHGFGGGGGGMHFGPRSLGGGAMTSFRPYRFGLGGLARSRFYPLGGFAHYHVGRYTLGRAYGWGHPATHYATFSRLATTTPIGAAGSHDHAWNGWRNRDHDHDHDHDRFAWRDHHRGWGGWYGPVFWPYAYNDLFDWSDESDNDLFWSYGYDDLFAGVLLPYAMLGPGGGYGVYAPARVVSGPAAQQPANAAPPAAAAAPSTAGQSCVSVQSLAGGAAIDPIAKAVQPNADQGAKLDALKNAETDAQKTLAESCAAETPKTAVGRLDAEQTRLQAMIKAADAVGGPLGDFYASLTDEQKAAFNALGQGEPAANGAAAPNISLACGPNNAVPLVALDQINAAVQPDAKQQAALAALRDAAGKADDAILASCPKQAPLTPTGRLDAVKARLQAMANGVDLIKPPLQDFYASLSDEQKAKFDMLTQPPAENEVNAKTQP